jgi:hypothetical protein
MLQEFGNVVNFIRYLIKSPGKGERQVLVALRDGARGIETA